LAVTGQVTFRLSNSPPCPHNRPQEAENDATGGPAVPDHILDDIQELASEPVADPEPLRSKIEAFLRGERELTNGEEAGE
jgi:hypothetical protein